MTTVDSSETESTAEGAPTPAEMLAAATFDGTFTCPRCKTATAHEYYGPCETCCTDLRATQGGSARDVEAAAYEPKMNVTPNAVALKE